MRRLHDDERGQSTAFFIALLVLLFGMMALAIDVGFFFHARRLAQNAADASALAGAAELDGCGDGTPTPLSLAEDFAELNLELGAFTTAPDVIGPITFGTHDVEGVDFPTITSQVERTQSFLFARVLGLVESEVPAKATAACVSGRETTICPFYIRAPDPAQGPTSATPYGLYPGEYVYKFKFAAQGGINGNRGFLRIYGTGVNRIRDGIEQGCVDPDDGTDYVIVTEPNPDDFEVAIEVDTEPGNVSSLFTSIETLYEYEGTTVDGVSYPSQAYCDIEADYLIFPSDSAWDHHIEVTDEDLEEKLANCADDPDPTDNIEGRYWPILLTESDPCNGACTVTGDHVAIMYVACWGERCGETSPGHSSVFGIFVTSRPFLAGPGTTGITANPLGPKHVLLIE